MSTLLQDTFTDADGTNLTAHTMTVGSGWTQHNGAWTVQSNRARPPAATFYSYDSADAGQADVTATLNLVIPGGNPLVLTGFMIRGGDQDNGWLCIVES